ncbi:LOW QUALITY PROTEIN: hypothetical protein BRARA_B03932 [Brassica rapa]|uniref:DUF4283 domain-containing protein n=1 Tax=Brassica campestris TaxID=3711 RepID=A0A398ANZ8_BRACM|nr:LOW QUALITY PROTEIN: hypothetical protein BRARA_B03932 [Brassica rapa]
MGRKLQKKGEPFVLPSGESCIKIPNAVIEKNRKSWDCFVLGQFYSDPPSQGTLHNIVNGIWSKTYRDISVSKMEGHSFLFRIPNANTRSRVIYQRLWQIEGQTMFVDKWEPGVIPAKPELTSAPIWLELRQVPFQFFNEDGLERIAGLVGHPKFLHPSTANKTNLEVAKVFTIIDPRKPLPEAVNVQFDSGDISRVLVSSPWMPPVKKMKPYRFVDKLTQKDNRFWLFSISSSVSLSPDTMNCNLKRVSDKKHFCWRRHVVIYSHPLGDLLADDPDVALVGEQRPLLNAFFLSPKPVLSSHIFEPYTYPCSYAIKHISVANAIAASFDQIRRNCVDYEIDINQ